MRPVTEAGKKLAAMAPSWETSAIALAIEAEAIEQERARLRAAVEGLPVWRGFVDMVNLAAVLSLLGEEPRT